MQRLVRLHPRPGLPRSHRWASLSTEATPPAASLAATGATEISVQGPGIRYAGVSWGDPASKHKVLCLHGWMDNAGTMAYLGPRLAERTGAHVVAMECPGHGRSEHRPPSSPYVLNANAADMAYCLQSLGWGWGPWDKETEAQRAASAGSAPLVEGLPAETLLQRPASLVLVGHSLGAGLASFLASALAHGETEASLSQPLPRQGPKDETDQPTASDLQRRVEWMGHVDDVPGTLWPTAAVLIEGLGLVTQPDSVGPQTLMRSFLSRRGTWQKQQERARQGTSAKPRPTMPSVHHAARARSATAEAWPGDQTLGAYAAECIVRRGSAPAGDASAGAVAGSAPGGPAAGVPLEYEGPVSFTHDSRLRESTGLYLTEKQMCAMLEGIRCPSMLVEAERGWPFPPDIHARRLQALSPDKRLRLDSSHHPHLEPEARDTIVDETISFWRQHVDA